MIKEEADRNGAFKNNNAIIGSLIHIIEDAVQVKYQLERTFKVVGDEDSFKKLKKELDLIVTDATAKIEIHLETIEDFYAGVIKF